MQEKEITKLSELAGKPRKYVKKPIEVRAIQVQERIWINTREGMIIAEPGDYIIEGIQGEIYPCGQEIFGLTYEPLED